MMMPQKFAIYVLLIGLFAFTSVSLSAQDAVIITGGQANAEYAFHIPSASEYQYLFEKILDTEPLNQGVLYAAVMDVERQIRASGLHETNNLYQFLANNVTYAGIHHDLWVNHIFQEWLTDRDVLPGNFADWQIDAGITVDNSTYVDFQNDGSPELVLKISKDVDQAQWYEGYHVVYRDEVGNLHSSLTPLGYNRLPTTHWAERRWEPQFFGDINADGSIEWLVKEWHTNTGMGLGFRGYELWILAWNGHELVNIAPEDGLATLVGSETDIVWQYLNLDDDPAKEITQSSTHSNSWGCSFDRVTTADWSPSDGQYITLQHENVYPQTSDCVLTAAEETMWQEDYETAIPLYENALKLADSEGLLTNDRDKEKWQYAQLRLALAYALTGKRENATNLIRALQQEPAASDGMAELIAIGASSYLPQNDEVALCIGMYNYFALYGGDNSYGYNSPLGTFVGFTLVDLAQRDAGTPPASAAGCPVHNLFEQRIGEKAFTFADLPAEKFEAAGIAVSDRIRVDVNLDGIYDWVLWSDAAIRPYIFISDKALGEYVLSQTGLLSDQFHDAHYEVINLPDDSGPALAWLVVKQSENNFEESCEGEDHLFTHLTLLKVDSQTLNWLFSVSACGRVPLNQLLSADARTITSPGNSDSDSGITFIWDSNQQIYQHDQIDTPVEATEIVYPVMDDYLGLMYSESYYAFERASINLRAAVSKSEITTDLISEIEIALDIGAPDITPEMRLEAQYYRAVALEALNRPDEALAEYVAIYEAAPDSAWGMLAALHLEVVNQGEPN